jgi:Integrase core domain
MNRERKALLQQLNQLRGTQRGVLSQALLQEVDHRLGELVGPTRSRPLGHQAGQPGLLEERLGCIERRTGEAESGRHLADWLPFLAGSTQHLVLDLDQVAGVEEGVAGGEGGVADGNAFAERWVGSARREVLDRMLIFGGRHLEKVLAEYIDHYNHARPHQGIEQRRPWEPADVIPLPTGRVERRDRLGGVLREYSRTAA